MLKITWIHDTHFEDYCKELGVAWTYNIKLPLSSPMVVGGNHRVSVLTYPPDNNQI